jgi:hypothetical protein
VIPSLPLTMALMRFIGTRRARASTFKRANRVLAATRKELYPAVEPR